LKYNTENSNSNIISKLYYGLIKQNYRYITSPLRILPNFFVIGVVRSGTTSLFHYLNQHPNISGALYDELGYFDDNYHLGVNWYKSLFPTIFTKKRIQKEHGKFLSFDDTPFYVYNPQVVRRIHENFPNAKMILLLRNPIDRAYSNYNLPNFTKLTFEEIIQNEIDEINNIDLDSKDESYLVNDFYEKILPRGLYAKQLEYWYKIFPKEKIFIQSSEEFANNTHDVLKQIFDFLGIKQVKIPDITKQNVRKIPLMKQNTRDYLIDFFKPYNESLYKLINKKFNWN
jgi:hypothetical protein